MLCSTFLKISNDNPGKSSLLFYLLLHRLSNKGPTALQEIDHFILFQDSHGGVRIYSGKDYEVTIPEGTLALTGIKKGWSPCVAFLNAERDGHARIIRVTTLLRNCRKWWDGDRQVCVWVMNYFSRDEIKVLGLVQLDCARTFLSR